MKIPIISRNSLLQFFNKKQTQHISILFFLWVIALMLIQPFGNFPLYDDWVFSKTLQLLYEKHIYRYFGFTTSHFLPLVPHYILGYLFCIPLGFSFIMIRISTILLSIVGVIYFYFLIHRMFNDKLAFILAVLVAFNPLYFILSYSYMTDVPFFVYTIITLFYFLKYLETKRNNALYLCILFSIITTLTRQLGIVLSFMMIIVCLFQCKKSYKPVIFFTLSFLLNIIVYIISLKIFKIVQNEHSADTGLALAFDALKQINIVNTLSRYNAIIFLTSLCLIPIQILTIPQIKLSRIRIILSFIFLLPLFIIPNYLIGTYINNFSLGPLTTKDVYGFKVLNTLGSNNSMTLLICIGIISSFLFLIQIISFIENAINEIIRKETTQRTQLKIGLFIYIVIYCFLFMTFPGVCDRYLLPIIIFSAILLIGSNCIIYSKKHLFILVLSLLLLISMSIIGTHDYFSLHKAKWNAVTYLLKDKRALPSEFDAGYEANGWYNFSSPLVVHPNKSWWYVTDDKYIVALSPYAGYSIIKEYPFTKWFHKYTNTIFVLERNSTIDKIKPQTTIDFESINNDSSAFVTSNQLISIPTKETISRFTHSGKYALLLTDKTANKIAFNLANIHSDDYCEMRFWVNTPTPNIKIKVKVFSLQYDVGIERIKTDNGWNQFKCVFFASSWISDFADNIDIKFELQDKNEIVIDDVKLLLIKKGNKANMNH